MSTARRIDVHQHVVPPFWAEALAVHGGDPSGSAMPKWSPEAAVAFMDSQEIQTGILSLTTPSVEGWVGDERYRMSRRINDYTADLVAKRPDRFGHFATLPIPDIEGSIRELARAFDTLHADGVVVHSNYAGAYLGDAAFEALWAELDRRAAVVFVHPTNPPFAPGAGIARPLVDFPFDTTRAAIQLVLSGVIARYPSVRVILAHAGGFLPYGAHRVAELAGVFNPGAPRPSEILASFQRFYFETSLSAGAALPTLQAFAPSGHILFGSDFPYAQASVAAEFTKTLDRYAGLTPAEHDAVDRESALALFPRLAPNGGDVSSPGRATARPAPRV
jgi:6-methylsalicylate decarboxylase